jgi:hypothetical protein
MPFLPIRFCLKNKCSPDSKKIIRATSGVSQVKTVTITTKEKLMSNILFGNM